MSADARVARAIQDVRGLLAVRPTDIPPHLADWVRRLSHAATDLADEAQDALHLTDNDIANC